MIPLKAEANERSEQISQILFGEAFEIFEWTEHWVKITTVHDNYTGWIGRLQFKMLGHIAFSDLKQTPSPLTYHPVTQAWQIANNSILYLPIGSSLAFLKGTTCNIANERFEIIGAIGESENISLTARKFLNTPYLWGGRTHFGIDCSGFTQTVFKLQGINLKRDAYQQAEQGYTIPSLHECKAGDLAFFSNDEGKIVHVGILLSEETIIHASGKVKIDSIDEKGIFSQELKRYTHKINMIKRLI